MSVNDIEKTFNYLCFKLLKEQDDEDSKISNISRSWSPLKSALRVWFRQYVSSESRDFYSLFINDIYREQESVFRPAITQAIKEYKPVLAKIIEEKREEIESRSGTIFTIRDEYGFSEDFEEVNVKLCAISPCYFQKEYLGKINESKFREYIDNKEELIEWWFKNGDMGQEFFSIKYFSSKEKAYRLFYPDWIIRFKNGKTGIFDTKSGDTAKSDDTIDKARALYEKIKTLGNKFVGGIVIPSNGVWQFHEGNVYDYDGKTLDVNWKNMETLFSS
jgi:type III restriction enzyme